MSIMGSPSLGFKLVLAKGAHVKISARDLDTLIAHTLSQNPASIYRYGYLKKKSGNEWLVKLEIHHSLLQNTMNK